MSRRYLIWAFILVGCFASCTRSEVEEDGASWKYLVERTTTEWDKVAEKKGLHIDRAFVYYGAGAKQAGGQRRGVPQVVYIDEKGNPLAKAAYYGPVIIPRRDAKKFELLNEIGDGMGSEPNRPVHVSIVADNFPILPLKPDAQLKEGLEWSAEVYLCIMVPKLWFPVTINHKMTGYQRKQGRRCAVIEYVLEGELKTAQHPSRFVSWVVPEGGGETRGEYGLKGHGKAYFDPGEEIIVEKEQTLSWTRHGELGRVHRDGIDWVTTQDVEESVDILVSLQLEEGAATGLPPVVYVLIIGGAGIVVAAIAVQLRRKGTRR